MAVFGFCEQGREGKAWRLSTPKPGGSSSRIEGLGSSMDGVKGESPPCGFGQRPRSFFCHAKRGSALAEKRRRPRSKCNLV